MLLDANILIYASDTTSPFHRRATSWLTDALVAGQRVGIPAVSITAFVRIVTHPRLSSTPAAPEAAVRVVRRWMSLPTVWMPMPGRAHQEIFCDLVERLRLTGNLITDASLAALALEHGLTLYSVDHDFARFPEVNWVNPLPAPGR